MDTSKILTAEQLKVGVNGAPVSGIALVRGYSIQLTKNGKEYIQGTIESGAQLPFKAWGNSVAFQKLKDSEFSNVATFISGNYDNYGGVLSIIATDVTAVDCDDISPFLPVRYSEDSYWQALKALFDSKVSDKAKAIANKVLFENDEVAKAFKIEYAASSHHDCCKSGLLAHTYKVLANLSNMLMIYNFANNQDRLDLLYFGALVHDIGKTKEMNLGVYQKCSSVTHRYLGIEMMDKDAIVEAYGTDWWLDLVSIFLQHHGEFDDKCRTLPAYIIHTVDMLDSRMTDLVQALEQPVKGDSGYKVRQDGNWLTI